ncbi:hypothetical protein CMV_030300 [Castanea mollissima]|uniref:Uncharacterized protein n=1 Tax=Castanea mollissima TaxID=60419 RepID=A0A8J4V386_9ROSI|nr:hypothetical protein CMV_030300 [Castanea mollissima]
MYNCIHLFFYLSLRERGTPELNQREHRLEKIKASTLQVTNPKEEQPPANEYQNLYLRERYVREKLN